ncbi:uncharacterized protein CTRU02_215433 [Colletotrichum truncatum]|uniref:Uncharacterized protein n=1 Tax=Colletotrichum truncatum TaxID=5467 RepID=A0ACC3YCH5_COLTU|nr:uncharacterized protein CTRU02_05627 [Colletotrichum truncatum]KAF6794070.1 hypothetical protein CTRU02_05627 [Colletotrichum truncatum]
MATGVALVPSARLSVVAVSHPFTFTSRPDQSTYNRARLSMIITRDLYGLIPNLADWMKMMSSKGHTVILLGKDLLHLADSSFNDSLDNRVTLKLWLAVVAKDIGIEDKAGGYSCRMLIGDDVVQYCSKQDLTEAHIKGQLQGHVGGRLVPLPGAYENNRCPQWFKVDGGPNIDLVWTRGYDTEEGADVYLCPVAFEGRCPQEVEGFKMSCDPLTPGWVKGEPKHPQDLPCSIPFVFVEPDANGQSKEASILRSQRRTFQSRSKIHLILNVACGRGLEAEVVIGGEPWISLDSIVYDG